jgi:hypothetical protein
VPGYRFDVRTRTLNTNRNRERGTWNGMRSAYSGT